MKWQLEFCKNALFGLFPLSVQEKLRKIKRTFLPYEVQINVTTLEQGLKQVAMLKAAGHDPVGKNYLELGTGWSPVIPLVFALAGCKSLTLVDMQRLMDGQTFSETCTKLIAYKTLVAEKLGLSEASIEQQLNTLGSLSFESALTKMNCRYLAPSDLSSNDLQAHSLDIISSRAVLEHIPPAVIKSLFATFNRLLNQRGAMCHIIDNSDHWEHNDKSISRVNFLKYSQKTFDFFSSMNPLDYQNRLRHSMYKQMLQEAGFKVIQDESLPDEQTLTVLETLNVHPSFNDFSKEDLAILTSFLVAEK